MFGGLVEAIGHIREITVDDIGKHFLIESPFNNFIIGESIAVNGICLTVTQAIETCFKVTAVPETLTRTNLNSLLKNSPVNLERSLVVNSRLGGHFVQGHVDNVGKITQVEKVADSAALLIKIEVPTALTKYMITKGFIAIDGMSLTIIEVGEDFFTVTLIPHTQAVTLSQFYAVGSIVNIEVDSIGKYVEKMLGVANAAIN